MIGETLQQALALAVGEVKRRRHEYLTLEHVLYGIVSSPAGKAIIDGCGADPTALRRQLEEFFSVFMESLPEGQPEDVVHTVAVQRVLDNALTHIHASGKSKIEVGDVLAGIFEEDSSWAAYYLRKEHLTRLDVLEYISHDQPGAAGTEDKSDEPQGGSEQSDMLQRYAVDLIAKAKAGDIDPLIGRDAEVARLIEILARRRKNNPLLIGEPGTGKTAIVEGLALCLVEGRAPEEFHSTRLFSLDFGAVLAGARYRGDFEGRIKGVVNALKAIPGAILFIDEIHTIVGGGSTSGSSMDASNLLKPVLAAGELRCIGSTTHEEYRNHLEKDRALARRFQRLDITEPSEEACVDILKGLQERYAAHHRVRYVPEALRAAVELSSRHLQDRLLPDKAIDVMDEAGAAVRLRDGFVPGTAVTRHDVEQVVARMAGIPETTVNHDERESLAHLHEDLASTVFGQQQAVDLTVKAILRSRAGLRPATRPTGSFLFYGPTGVGKTELAKQIAERMGISFIRFDMSEYMEKHAVSRLIGAPPGYVGFDQGGLLTEAVRKTPHAVVLLDEIEKAHPDMYDILLQVMDYGTLTDNTGRKADFRHVILIMTSNAGARDMASQPMGFVDAATGGASRRALKAVENAFSPEFRNRLDAMVPFNSLTPDLMGYIVDKSVKELTVSLKGRGVNLSLTDAARTWLAREGYDPSLGARPLQRLLREALEDPLAAEMLFGKLAGGGSVKADVPKGAARELALQIRAPKKKRQEVLELEPV